MIHIYTGDGKGKTTAAFGLALRAAGAGKRVYICQFMKNAASSELRAVRPLRNITVESPARCAFLRGRPSSAQVSSACRAFEKVSRLIGEKRYDLYILDEVIVAVHFKLIEQRALLSLLSHLPRETEVVLTGRKAGLSLIRCADLVTEMRERKHYFRKGVKARRGIEY